jgi:polyphosphate kinase
MYRNLSRRVEVLTPIKDAQLKTVLKDTVLAGYLKDNVNARELRSDGTYVRVKPAEGEKRFDCQLEFETEEFSPVKRDRIKARVTRSRSEALRATDEHR